MPWTQTLLVQYVSALLPALLFVGICALVAWPIVTMRRLRRQMADALNERTRLDAELASGYEARERLAAIVEHSGDAIFTKNLNGIIETWNQSAERLFGYTADEIVGKPITMLIPQERLDEEPRILASLRAGRPVERMETVRVAKGGRRINVLISVSPLRDRHLRVIGASKTVHDITAVVEARAAIEAARRQTEETLRLEAQRKDEFLAILSHELRNPLAPIQLASSLLKRPHIDTAELSRLHDVLERQTRQLTRLLDDLLDVSRINSGKIQLRKERLDLALVIANAVEVSQPVIDTAGHTLIVELPERRIDIDGDPARLAQLLTNLLNNAAKYTHRGGTITISAERSGSDARVRVRDTGIGIAPGDMNLIFDLFVQGARLNERGRDGLGVGLALAKRLAELHGGRLEARSAGVGHGSEFIVTIPLSAEAVGSIQPMPSVQHKPMSISL